MKFYTGVIKMKYLITEMEMKFLMIGRASLVTQMLKNLPAMQEAQVQSLGQEDSLEKSKLLTSNKAYLILPT